jgi:hypothetical protein
MAFFNFIETFFFISLGITFVLILLLVYHFKQRMTGLEQKCDTMFEIINDVVKELNLLRIQNNMQQPAPGFFQPMRNFMPPFNIDEILNKNSSDVFDGANHDEDDDESDESSDVGNSDDDDEDDEDVHNDEADIINDFLVEESDENIVKIINVNQETLTELDVDELANLDGEDSEQLEDGDEDEDEDIEQEDGEVAETELIAEDLTESILVEKIEPIEETETNIDSIDHKESDKDVYKKMSLGALKALVISKGLCSDARTLRKNELLKLLDEAE